MNLNREDIEEIVAAIAKIGSWCDWTGYVGDGKGPGVFEANAMMQAEAIKEAGTYIAEAIEHGLVDIANAVRGK